MPKDDYSIRIDFGPEAAATIKRAAGILGRQIKPFAEQVFIDYCRRVVTEDRRSQLQPPQELTGDAQ